MGQSSTFITIDMDPTSPLDYVPDTEHHHSIISTVGGHGGRLEIEI